jgi:tRNA uridine 5-carbamoylmethylation protein Kti12
MKLIVLYGPPASGKLTVAKELSKLTGYNIFHNQLTVDLLTTIIPFGEGDFFKISDKLRLEMYNLAAKNKVSLISTFCYDKKTDKKFINNMVNAYRNRKGQVHFVKLECHKDTLFKRVKEPSRRVHKKVKTKKGLKEVFKKYDLFNKMHKYRSLIIDNTRLSAKKTALKIKEHYKL